MADETTPSVLDQLRDAVVAGLEQAARRAADSARNWHSQPRADVRPRLSPRQAWLLANLDARASESRTAVTVALQNDRVREAASALLAYRERLDEGARLRTALWAAFERGEPLEHIGSAIASGL